MSSTPIQRSAPVLSFTFSILLVSLIVVWNKDNVICILPQARQAGAIPGLLPCPHLPPCSDEMEEGGERITSPQIGSHALRQEATASWPPVSSRSCNSPANSAQLVDLSILPCL